MVYIYYKQYWYRKPMMASAHNRPPKATGYTAYHGVSV